MIKPRILPPMMWLPTCYVLDQHPQIPDTAGGHFIVNSARQVIFRAMISSKVAYRSQK
jgi:hypothetical protein